MDQTVNELWRTLDFQGRTDVWLARVTGFSEAHVRAIKSGRYAPSKRFREACALALQVPEDVLFRRQQEVTSGDE